MSNSKLASVTLISPNKNSPRNKPIDRISIHCFVGQVTAKRGCEVFQPTSKKASCNYVVGYDGSIGLCVDEGDRSWCTSSAANDHRAVTIETASDNKDPYAVTDKAYAALLDLVEDICRRNGKTKLLWLGDKDKTLAFKPAADEMVLTVHRWFANKACPGQYLLDRHPEIAAEVTRRLGGDAQTSGTGTTQATDNLYRVRKTWADAKSQVGAYKSLANAKRAWTATQATQPSMAPASRSTRSRRPASDRTRCRSPRPTSASAPAPAPTTPPPAASPELAFSPSWRKAPAPAAPPGGASSRAEPGGSAWTTPRKSEQRPPRASDTLMREGAALHWPLLAPVRPRVGLLRPGA